MQWFLKLSRDCLRDFMFFYVATRFPFNSNFLVKSIQLCSIKKALFFLLQFILLQSQSIWLFPQFPVHYSHFILLNCIQHCLMREQFQISIPQFPLLVSLCDSTWYSRLWWAIPSFIIDLFLSFDISFILHTIYFPIFSRNFTFNTQNYYYFHEIGNNQQLLIVCFYVRCVCFIIMLFYTFYKWEFLQVYLPQIIMSHTALFLYCCFCLYFNSRPTVAKRHKEKNVFYLFILKTTT